MMIDWKLISHGSGSDMKKTAVQSVTPSTIVNQEDDTLFAMYGGNANLSYALNTHFIKSGIEYKYSKSRDDVQTLSNGVDVTQPSDNVAINQDKYAVYLQDEWSVSDVFVVTPGIRYEKIDRDYGSVSALDYFAPSLHALFKLTPNDNLRASVAKTVKLPRLDEISTSVNSSLSDNTIDHPDTTGNPSLTEETALSYELRGEHYFEDKGIMSASGFYRDIEDKIENLTTLESGRYVKKPYNAGTGKLWGVELELKKPLTMVVEGLGLWGNATFQNSTLHNTTSGFTGVIGETSDVVANIGIDHSYTPYRLTYGIGYRYDGGFDDPIDQSGIEKSQKAFGVLDVYATKKLDSTFKLTLNAKNITSETIMTTSNRYSGGALVQTQVENEHSQPQFLLTLEGKW
jgi:iron complex outermembrane receptor protein